MNWRNLSIIIVLVLANYLVFSTLAVLVFPPKPIAPPTHEVQPSFTPGARTLQRVGTLTYDFRIFPIGCGKSRRVPRSAKGLLAGAFRDELG